MINLEIAAGGLVFISVSMIVFSTFVNSIERRKWIEALVNRINANTEEPALIKKLENLVLNRGKVEELKDYIAKAGLEGLNPEKIYYMGIILAITLSSIFFGVFFFQNKIFAIITAATAAISGFKLPAIAVKYKAESIQKAKRTGVLAYAETLQIACDAGLTFIQAVERISKYFPSPLSLEFKRAYDEFYQNQKTKKEALLGITERVGGDDIKLLIDAIVQSDEMGTSPAAILKSLTTSIRNTTKKIVEEKGKNAVWKNFLVTMSIQFPAYLFILTGPAIVTLIESLG